MKYKKNKGALREGLVNNEVWGEKSLFVSGHNGQLVSSERSFRRCFELSEGILGVSLAGNGTDYQGEVVLITIYGWLSSARERSELRRELKER